MSPTRLYDPTDGMFISRDALRLVDPKATPGRIQPWYHYAMNNPVTLVDGDGRFLTPTPGNLLGGWQPFSDLTGWGERILLAHIPWNEENTENRLSKHGTTALRWASEISDSIGIGGVGAPFGAAAGGLGGAVFAWVGLGGMFGLVGFPGGCGVGFGLISPAQETELASAIEAARRMVAQALGDLCNLDPIAKRPADVWERFELWFGDSTDGARREKVMYRYYSMSNELRSKGFRAHLILKGNDDTYADTGGIVPDYKTTLQRRFWKRDPKTPPSSMAGILIHELSHAVDFGVMDPSPTAYYPEQDELALGRAWAKDPAKSTFGVNNRKDKINDGDSYKWFAEKQK